MSQNREQEFVNTEIWNLFRNRFKSASTEASYRSDIQEFCRLAEKPMEEAGEEDVRHYYAVMQKRIADGRISPLTLTKKFRELHSFTQFLIEYEGGESRRKDFFHPYLKRLAKEDRLARSVPVEEMDALLKAAECDQMAYTILTLMYRAGLSSTEIVELNGEEDFALYDDGAYVFLPRRQEPCYVPEDAWEILKDYLSVREPHPSLFYNRRGGRLNGMYISRMMKKYCTAAGIRNRSAESVRNCCAFNLFAYGASPGQVAGQLGRTEMQIRRYRGLTYRRNLRKRANDLVKMRIEKPQI